MGAYLLIKPSQGAFNTDEIVSHIEENKNVARLESAEKSCFVFRDSVEQSEPDLEHVISLYPPQTSFEATDQDQLPTVDIVDKDKIQVTLNWSDTQNNDVRLFAQWLLSRYECEGLDFQGYTFANNQELTNWIDMWLPRHQYLM